MSPDVHQVTMENRADFNRQILTEHKDLFSEELGELPVTYSMTVDPNIQPVIQPGHRIPVTMQERVKAELERMQSIGQPCSVIIDDIFVGGRGVAEHDANLRRLLERAIEVNLRLNPNKGKFRLDQVGYTRAALPVGTKLLELAPKITQQVNTQPLNKRLTLKHQYDKSSHPLQPLAEGQVVRRQTPKGYHQLGTVKEMSKELCPYIIQSNGKTYRRNRCHILPVAEPLPPAQLCAEDQDPQNNGPSTTDSVPPTPHTPEPNNMQSQHKSSSWPKLTAYFPTENSNALYTTRSGRACMSNPKYME
ncbi:hypothetical protein AOLI_G00003350 [Acnodon oligacanthus]